MEWKSAEKKDNGLTRIPERWLHIHYFEALNILFRFENSVRVFVYAVLKNEFQDGWDTCSFSFSGSDPQSIKRLAAKRIAQAENFGYLGFDIRAPLMHLTSGELIELLTSDAYWPKFRSHFRGNKEIIKNKLLEIGTIRNALAHFRPIRADDIELIKQNSRHTLLGVEQCLKGLFSQSIRVPTNTNDDWYRAVSTLGTEHVSTTPFCSPDEKWINVKLTFKSPILTKQEILKDYYTYTLANVNSSHLLRERPILRKHVTYLTEHVAYPSLSKEWDLAVSKDLNFVFRRDVLVRNHTEIAGELSETLRMMTDECDLLSQDNLARGRIVEPASANAFWVKPEGKEARLRFNYNEISQTSKPNDPDEYWGQQVWEDDLIAALPRYPWMPEDISDSEFPF